MIFETAGRVGLDPRPFTWRQLDDFDHGARREAWKHTGDICYAIAVSNGSKIARDTFDRYSQQYKTSGPTRTVKPSEIRNIG